MAKGLYLIIPMPTERVVVASHFHSSTSLVLTSIAEISTFLTEVIKANFIWIGQYLNNRG